MLDEVCSSHDNAWYDICSGNGTACKQVLMLHFMYGDIGVYIHVEAQHGVSIIALIQDALSDILLIIAWETSPLL